MEPFVAFKYLHIVSMFFAVALAVSGELVLRGVASSADPGAIRTAIARIEPLSRGADVLFLAGVAFGIIAAVTGRMNLLAPWLVLSYCAVVAAFALGALVIQPWAKRLEAAASASPDGASSPELRRIVDEPVARFATWALMALIAAIVFLMVVKPLG